jgi:hypothetical protein
MDNDLSVVIYHGTGVIVQPKYFEGWQLGKIFDFPEVSDAIFTKIELLNSCSYTCSLLHLPKSRREEILLTLREMTYRLGIFSMSCRSSSSLPQRLRFLML